MAERPNSYELPLRPLVSSPTGAGSASTTISNGDLPNTRIKRRKSSCWRHRTSLEKSLIAALLTILLFLLFVLLLLIYISAYFERPKSLSNATETDTICTTSDCVKTAATVMEGIDFDVDPCEDFYQFSCGRWDRSHVIPEDNFAYSTFDEKREKLYLDTRRLLERPVDDDDIPAFREIKTFYNSCVNVTTKPDYHIAELRKWITNDFYGFPMIEGPDWEPDDQNHWLGLLASIGKYHVQTIFDIDVGEDDKNSSYYVVRIDQPDIYALGMPRSYLVLKNSPHLYAYKMFILSVIQMMEPKIRQINPNIEREVDKLIDFNVKLAHITVPDSERRDFMAMYKKMTIGEMQDLYAEVDWLTQINYLTNPTILNKAEEVVIYASSYLHELMALIKETEHRVRINFIMWIFLKSKVENLKHVFERPSRVFQKALFGFPNLPPRWEYCLMTISNDAFLEDVVGRLYVDAYFDKTARTKAEEMVVELQKAFVDILNSTTWFDEETLAVAIEKVNNIDARIGYSELLKDDAYLNDKYANLDYHPYNYLDNVQKTNNRRYHERFGNLRKKVNRTIWEKGPAVVNAFYQPNKNQIIFPAGILQKPFYDEKQPISMNFGAMGMVIGHEITHGFDDKGRLYDKGGTLRQWWSDTVIEKFKNKTKCIIEQYNNYSYSHIPHLHINGKNTQGENIADNGGIKEAFWAFKNWEKRHPEITSYLLPGLDLNHDQLFFINFAQVWCGITRREALEFQIQNELHTPGYFRVIGTLSNSEDFAEAFQCPTGSKMNPALKCGVW